MKVLTIVVLYNGSKWIRTCFSSLFRSTINDHHIIAIDNASTDNSVEIIRSEFPDVELIKLSNNIGFGRANNIGLQKAHDIEADYVFLLNQDAWVENKTIENLINIQQLNNEFGIISPLHFNTSDLLDENFLNYLLESTSIRSIMSDLCQNSLNDIYSIHFVNAAIWLISKDCYDKVGLFDNLFFHYGEDRNYSQRAIYHGFKIGVAISEKGWHDRKSFRSKSISPIKYKYLSHAFMLVTLGDVNSKNLFISYIKFIKNRLKNIANNLFSLNLKYLLIDLKTIIYALIIIRKVNFSKSINRKPYIE